MSGGGFWPRNDGNTDALPGMMAFANFADRTMSFALAGSVQSRSVTRSLAADSQLLQTICPLPYWRRAFSVRYVEF
jgi:hypothetical protein